MSHNLTAAECNRGQNQEFRKEFDILQEEKTKQNRVIELVHVKYKKFVNS